MKNTLVILLCIGFYSCNEPRSRTSRTSSFQGDPFTYQTNTTSGLSNTGNINTTTTTATNTNVNTAGTDINTVVNTNDQFSNTDQFGCLRSSDGINNYGHQSSDLGLFNICRQGQSNSIIFQARSATQNYRICMTPFTQLQNGGVVPIGNVVCQFINNASEQYLYHLNVSTIPQIGVTANTPISGVMITREQAIVYPAPYLQAQSQNDTRAFILHDSAFRLCMEVYINTNFQDFSYCNIFQQVGQFTLHLL